MSDVLEIDSFSHECYQLAIEACSNFLWLSVAVLLYLNDPSLF